VAYQEISLLEFQNQFDSEDKCVEYLFRVRWPEGFRCPRCQHDRYYTIARRGLYECQACRHQVSVSAGTIFHRTKVPLRKWFWLIYRMAISKTGVSIAEMQRELQIRDYKTIWVMAHKIREAMGQRDARYRLAGLVELDESFFGPTSREGKRGRGSERKTTVLIAVSIYTNKQGIESPGFAHAQVVTDASADTIGRVLDRLGVDEGDKKLLINKIRSDGWKSYGKVAKDKDIAHHRVVLISPKMAGHLLPWTHRFVSNVKAVLRGPHRGVSAKHLQRYLSEACYRFNRRYWDHELFNRLLFACTVGVPITRDKLLARGNGSVS
jgi:transposase-like protein